MKLRMSRAMRQSFVIILLSAIALLPQLAAQTPSRPSRAELQNPQPATESAKEVRAEVAGASAENIRRTIEKLVSFGNRSTLSAQDADSIAKGQGIGAAREWIKSEFEKISKDCGGCLEVKTDEFTIGPAPRIPQPTVLVNVYAVLRGTDPENAKRIYLVTGHYDSRNSSNNNVTEAAPGANDDASGTAVSLECARLLSKKKFPATIIFLTVPGEEQGLNGSKHFAQMAKAAGWNIEAALNNDIVGGDKSEGQNPNVVRVFSEGIPTTDIPQGLSALSSPEAIAAANAASSGQSGTAQSGTGQAAAPSAANTTASGQGPAGAVQNPRRAQDADLRLIRSTGMESDSPSRELARYVSDVGRVLTPISLAPMLMFRPDRYLRGGDQTSFNEEGFTSVRFTEYLENYNHQHQNIRVEKDVEFGDLLKFVDFDYVAAVAKLNAATLASLAAAPAPPQKVRMNTRRLDNDTEITWEASPGGLATEYEVVWRETSAAEWQHVEKPGNALKIVLKMSKDNAIFGVRAVDAKGNHSLVVVPVPERGGPQRPVGEAGGTPPGE